VGERLLVLGEENVAADVGAETLAPEAAREASDASVRLEHLDITPEEIGREEAGDPSTKDANVAHVGH
jgi:hypothetical protein